MLNILAMAPLAPPDHCAGSEMMLMSMLRPLAERGHRVEFLMSYKTPITQSYDYHGITVHPHRGPGDPFPLVDAADVVIAHLDSTPRAVILSRRAHKPFVLVKHNTHEPALAWAVSDAALIVLNSEWMRPHFGDLPNGIVMRPPVFADDYRTTPGGKVTLVNLSAEKGGQLLADLAGRMPDVEFLAVEGAYGEQIIPDLPNVEYRPHSGDMRSVYGATRVLLMPSAYESWGRVGVEAMYSGIPVIAHPTPGLRESLGDAGWFCDRDAPAAWVATIRKVLSRKTWPAASRAALKRAGELDPAAELDDWVKRIEAIGYARAAA